MSHHANDSEPDALANPVFQGLLGLTPLLAVSTRLLDATIFALALLVILVMTSVLVALLRDWLAVPLRLLTVLLISAAAVSVVDMLTHAWLYEWHGRVGIYLPLLAVSTLLLAWLETAAVTRPWPALMIGSLRQGGIMLILLAGLGGVREALGHGSLLRGSSELPGVATGAMTVQWPAVLPLLAEPAGGLLLLGGLFAAWNCWQGHSQSRGVAA